MDVIAFELQPMIPGCDAGSGTHHADAIPTGVRIHVVRNMTPSIGRFPAHLQESKQECAVAIHVNRTGAIAGEHSATSELNPPTATDVGKRCPDSCAG